MDITVTPLLHEAIVINGAKRTMLQRAKAELGTVVVGSSHGDFGFNPAFFPGSFNLCCRSQDLKHSYLLYRHITRHYPAIGQLVLYYSVFSPGSFMERSPTEKFISPALNELFDLGIVYEDAELVQEYEKIRGRLGAVTVDSNGSHGFLPHDGKGFLPEGYGAASRARDHLRFNVKQEANLYLVRTLLLAKQLGHRVCIVVPPVRSDFKQALGASFDQLFGSLLEILNDFHLDYPVGLVNGFDNPRFSDSDFGDYDHLLPLGRGTEVLSDMIRGNFA